MSPLPHHLFSGLLHLLLLLNLLYTSIHVNSAKPSTTPCPSFDSGTGIVIGYPFWRHVEQLDHCGYPELGLSFADGDRHPVLHLSGDDYYVKKINYSEKTLTLTQVEVKEQNCPRARRNVTLDTSSLLSYSREDKSLCFFYNCTLYPPSPPSIECLRYGSKRSFMFMLGEIPEFDWNGFCESIVMVPVVGSMVDGLTVSSFGGALTEGFKLTWRSDSTCRSCEATGGYCGYSKDSRRSFLCFCPDGRHHLTCGNEGVISARFGPNFVAIGALVLGSFIITGTVLYLIQRRKLSSYKTIFF